MTCPGCGNGLEGLGTYCQRCKAYTEDLEARARAGAAVTVSLPLPPNMANGRMHWRLKDEKRREYLARCDAWHPKRGRTLGRARIRAVLYVWNKMDPDGAVARLKWAVDWLVRRGFLEDDSEKHLEWEMPKQTIDRSRQRIEIVLEPA